jgi:bacillithiol biosynthesis deacetylase BshB1
MSMNLDILAIAAHPGDVEASSGGTLIRMAELGYRTGVLDLTAGDMGTGGAPEERLAEAEIAARRLHLDWRDNQRMPDARLENSLAARMTLAVRIRELKPRVVILPHWEARHPDRVHCCELGVEACFLAGLPTLEEYSEPHRPERILYASFFAEATAEAKPSFVVDVSAQFERRLEALRSYAAPWAGAAALERMDALARFHGGRIGVRYGEPFVMKEALALDDIVGIRPRQV